jgi:hypothetical protein
MIIDYEFGLLLILYFLSQLANFKETSSSS